MTANEQQHPEVKDLETGEPVTGPFDDEQKNKVWRVLASQLQEGFETLADLDMMEQDPVNRRAAMKNERLAPFWQGSEQKELTGLWARGCLKR